MLPDASILPKPRCIQLPAAEHPEVSLLIPATSQAVALAACLQSLADHLPASVPCEVIVVLNAATTGVEHLVREECHGLRIAASEANLGVAGGFNLARSLARGRFLMLLHDDVEIGPGWLEPLLAMAAEYPEAGALGSRALNSDGSPQRAGSFLFRNGQTCAAPETDSPGPWPVDYVGTCATLVPALWWDAVGGMDEAIFPAYYVDVDLCLRLQQLGASVFCVPASPVLHHGGSSSASAIKAFYTSRNRSWFCQEHASLLDDYEPWVPGDPAAPARARERTLARAARLVAGQDALPQAQNSAFDPAAQQARHFKMELALQKAWAVDLHGQLESSREASAAIRLRERQLKAKLEEKNQQIATLKARCKALKNNGKRPSFFRRLGQWLTGKKPTPPES